MKIIWIAVGIIVITTALMVGFISYVCEDDWCYIFPWQKAKYVQSPTNSASQNIQNITEEIPEY